MTRHVEPPWTLPGSITVEVEGDRRVLCLRGDIDSAVVTRFRNRYGRNLPAVDSFDAGEVSFISSTGLAVLLRCSEAAVAAGRERPMLRAASHVTERVIHLAGLDSALLRRADPPNGDGPATP
jgi:anti-anti-sigma factor